jgi:hypothetical protein
MDSFGGFEFWCVTAAQIPTRCVTMSYDIYLYEKRFLQRALEDDLGDWTKADPFSEDKLRLIRDHLSKKGYVPQGDTDFEFPNDKWGLQASVFKGEVAFGIPYWDDADAAIERAHKDAKELAIVADLGFYDPQTGEAIT